MSSLSLMLRPSPAGAAPGPPWQALRVSRGRRSSSSSPPPSAPTAHAPHTARDERLLRPPASVHAGSRSPSAGFRKPSHAAPDSPSRRPPSRAGGRLRLRTVAARHCGGRSLWQGGRALFPAESGEDTWMERGGPLGPSSPPTPDTHLGVLTWRGTGAFAGKRQREELLEVNL